jgi:lysophospholipid acyltransferase (LPLAT)-like uncharacterized protein
MAMVAVRRLLRKKAWVRRAIGVLAAEYLRFVWKTSRFMMEPDNPHRMYESDQPVIIGVWHGQHFLLPFMRRNYPFKVLVSLHADGDINAIAAERLGVGTVRGSGDHGRRFQVKGGVAGFKGMLESLAEGWNMVLTADVPKISRVAGHGIIKLAQVSGRPIFPVSLATSRRIVLDNWDRSEINLPFSRGALVVGEPIRVPADADAERLEQLRHELETALNAASARAHTIADGRSRLAAGHSIGTA